MTENPPPPLKSELSDAQTVGPWTPSIDQEPVGAEGALGPELEASMTHGAEADLFQALAVTPQEIEQALREYPYTILFEGWSPQHVLDTLHWVARSQEMIRTAVEPLVSTPPPPAGLSLEDSSKELQQYFFYTPQGRAEFATMRQALLANQECLDFFSTPESRQRIRECVEFFRISQHLEQAEKCAQGFTVNTPLFGGAEELAEAPAPATVPAAPVDLPPILYPEKLQELRLNARVSSYPGGVVGFGDDYFAVQTNVVVTGGTLPETRAYYSVLGESHPHPVESEYFVRQLNQKRAGAVVLDRLDLTTALQRMMIKAARGDDAPQQSLGPDAARSEASTAAGPDAQNVQGTSDQGTSRSGVTGDAVRAGGSGSMTPEGSGLQVDSGGGHPLELSQVNPSFLKREDHTGGFQFFGAQKEEFTAFLLSQNGTTITRFASIEEKDLLVFLRNTLLFAVDQTGPQELSGSQELTGSQQLARSQQLWTGVTHVFESNQEALFTLLPPSTRNALMNTLHQYSGQSGVGNEPSLEIPAICSILMEKVALLEIIPPAAQLANAQDQGFFEENFGNLRQYAMTLSQQVRHLSEQVTAGRVTVSDLQQAQAEALMRIEGEYTAKYEAMQQEHARALEREAEKRLMAETRLTDHEKTHAEVVATHAGVVAAFQSEMAAFRAEAHRVLLGLNAQHEEALRVKQGELDLAQQALERTQEQLSQVQQQRELMADIVVYEGTTWGARVWYQIPAEQRRIIRQTVTRVGRDTMNRIPVVRRVMSAYGAEVRQAARAFLSLTAPRNQDQSNQDAR